MPKFIALLIGLGWGVAGLGIAMFGMISGAISIAAFLVMAGAASFGLARHYPHNRVGWCNVITATRLGLVAVLVGVIFWIATGQPLSWSIVVLAALAFALDGLDGWLARREDVVSLFGARFDVEVDSALAATLSVILLASGKAGVEILLLGFARYAFVLATLVWPWLTAPLPERFRRKVICVVQVAILVLLLVPVVPALPIVSLSGALLLCCSFALDILWLARHR